MVSAIIDVINPANWFDDDFHFSDVWDRLAGQALEGGKKVGSAFSDGWKAGMENWEKSHPKEKEEEKEKEFKIDPNAPINRISGTNNGSGLLYRWTTGKRTGWQRQWNRTEYHDERDDEQQLPCSRRK